MKKLISLICLIMLSLCSVSKAQITCRDFDHEPVSATKSELVGKKYELEYEYSNMFSNEEKNEFVIRLAADSSYYLVGVGGKAVKEYNVTIYDKSNNVVRTEKVKGRKNVFEFSPPADGDYTIEVVVMCKSPNCTYVAVFGKPK